MKTTKPVDDKEGKYDIKAVVRCLSIIDLAVEQPKPLSLHDVCNKLDINNNMAFRMLSTLVSSGYMTKDPQTETYSISLKSLKLSRKALLSMDIRKIAMPSLELLWSQYPLANGNLGVIYEDEIITIDRIDSQSIPLTYFTPGKAIPFYCTGLGKVLTCMKTDEEILDMLKRNPPRAYTKNTITDPESILRELHKVREEGIGRDREEFVEDDNCIAAPVKDSKGRTIAAISLSALTTNLTAAELESAIPKLKETVASISSFLS